MAEAVQLIGLAVEGAGPSAAGMAVAAGLGVVPVPALQHEVLGG